MLGLADVKTVEKFLIARKDLKIVLDQLKDLGIDSLREAIANIKTVGSQPSFHTVQQKELQNFYPTCR